MDITTIAGVSGVCAMVFIAVATGQVTKVFLNFHGLFLVGGGTIMSILLNTPLEYFWAAVKSVPSMLSSHDSVKPKTVLPVLISTSQAVHSGGINALRNVDQRAGAGFVAHAAQVALENNDPEYVRTILEQEIIQDHEHNNEIINVYRTMGIVSPMFGLIGTLIGIVDVLKHISNPEEVGANMAIAVTTAFYGILFANLFAVPVAGKLRLRHLQEFLMRQMVVEAVIEMLKGTVPAVLERKLKTFIAANS
jgi:chemotaxis protein MotA